MEVAGVTLFLAMLCFLSSVNILVTVMGQVFWGLSYALESGTIEAWFVNVQKSRRSREFCGAVGFRNGIGSTGRRIWKD